ncbi:hypothetical protein N665_0004s0054 [Sinapis alba]|nr:hypothetical protein N665_0004s0054 [Sinapis alba]
MGKSKASKKRAKDVVGNDVNADALLAAAVQRLQEILREHSEQEIRATLLECNMNQYFAVNRLLSQQETSNEQGTSNQMPTSSVLVPNQSAIRNGETRSVPISSVEAVPSLSVPSSRYQSICLKLWSVTISSTEAVPSFSVPSSRYQSSWKLWYLLPEKNDCISVCNVPCSNLVFAVVLQMVKPGVCHDVTNGETRTVPISSSDAVPPLSVPSSSDVTNGETRSVTISSNVPAPSLLVPSSRALTNVKPKRQATRMISASDPSMAEVLRGLHKKPDVTNRSSNSLTESDAARRDHLQESALIISNPQNSAFPVNQPMATRQSTVTASSLDLRPPTSMADLNSFFSSTEFQLRSGSNSYILAHDGNMMNNLYLWRPAQNNVPSSAALQQRGITNNEASIYESLDSVFAPYRNSTLPQPATSSVPSSHVFDMSSGNAANLRFGYEDVSGNQLLSNSSGGASIGLSSHGSAFGFDMTSGNNANSRFGYGDYLPPVHLQGTVQSEEIYFRPSHWRTPGYRPSQQEHEAYSERLRAYNASLNQENNTSDPSDQSQQRPRDK